MHMMLMNVLILTVSALAKLRADFPLLKLKDIVRDNLYCMYLDILHYKQFSQYYLFA